MLHKPDLAFLVLLLAVCTPAAGDGLALKKDVELKGSAVAGKAGLVFLTADRIESIRENIVEAEGKVEARQAGHNFFADWLRYDLNLNEIQARGEVRVEQPAMVVTGDTLRLKLDDHSGELSKPVYQLLETPGRGHANNLEFIDDDHYKLNEATYTTCPIGNTDWELKVADLDIDRLREVGTARNAQLQFMGTPILYTPWMDFPLNDARKSGILAPTFGTTGRSGIDIVVPYYFNLAPNYDATLYPRLLTRRGLQLGGDFRYLEDKFRSESRAEYLPNDNVTRQDRWGLFLKDAVKLNSGLTGGIDFNRVSDNDYLRDLSNLISVTSQSHLNQELWTKLEREWWDVEFRMQSFQTLQDSTAITPIAIPYNRLPQIKLEAARVIPGGLEFNLASETTYFTHPNQPDGTRLLAYPTLQWPLANSFGFFTPKLGWYLSRYYMDNTAPQQDLSLSVPIASLDTGIFMDRPFSFMGQSYRQTLEPRAYYVYAPFRDQSKFPVFDTALLDFSYAQMFYENQFIGGDRVNDANQLTLAMTTRFIEDTSGIERLKLTLGQRYYFSPQQVVLPGDIPRDRQSSDLLLAVSGQVTHDWKAEAGWQFNTDTGATVRQNLSASYRPDPGRTLNFGYRFIDQSSEQIDLSGQWPMSQRWYGMFRYNYSFKDSKLVEGLAGLEYNGGCWMARGVVQRLATKENQSTNAFFFQLELNGMGRLGSNPLTILKQSVPGYRPSNEFTENP